jgi:hypothetical protein
MLRRASSSVLVLCLVGISGCSSNFKSPTTTPVSIDLSLPANTTLLPGQTAQFTASVSNASNTGVYWQVDGALNGNSQVGTISDSGLYTAPSVVPVGAVHSGANAAPSSATVTITAAAKANASATATATVTLITAPVVSVSPTVSTLYPGGSQQFTATVTNATDTSVIWQVNGTTGGNSTIGTVTSTGLYSAPASVTSQTTVTVSAVSSIYSGSSAGATVTLKTAPAVSVSPSSASVMATKTQQFTATVSDNSAVTWEVNGTAGGSSTVGTISASGLYTAPSVIPNPATVTISAVSQEDSLVQGSATVTVTTLLQIVLMPGTATVQPLAEANFTATSTIPSDTLIWKVNNTTGGSSTLGTVTATGSNTATYSAPDPAPAAGFVTVEAYSTAYPAIFGAATVTIGNQAPGIAVSPGTASVALADTQQFSATVSPSNLSQAVTWSVAGVVGGNSTVGTICNTGAIPACASPGLYTAPSTLPGSPNPNPVTITATSTAEPNPGTAQVTITLPASVSVAVNPTTPPALASLTLGQSEAFTATVTPSNIPEVTWSVSSATAGLTCDVNANPNACGGTSADPSFSDSWNIIYTAPGSIPDSLQSATVNLIATSVSDPAVSGSTAITVTANPTIKISPATGFQISTGGTPQSFTATLAHVPANTAVFWSIGCINADEGPDECPANPNPSGGDVDSDGDGPGSISPASGTNTLTVTYTPPASHIYYANFPSNGCPAAVTGSYAYVPLTAKMTVNSQQYSDTVCIRVNGN